LTLCIAAVSTPPPPADQCIILCADTRIETEVPSSNNEIKIVSLQHPHWVGMFAGVISNARAVSGKISEVIAGVTLTRANVKDTLQRCIWDYKDSLIEDYVRSKFSLTYREFTQSDRIPPKQSEDAWRAIEDMKIECDLIIAGFIDTTPYLFFTDEQNGRLFSERDFAAIGTGRVTASIMLRFRQQNRGNKGLVSHIRGKENWGESPRCRQGNNFFHSKARNRTASVSHLFPIRRGVQKVWASVYGLNERDRR